VRLIRGAQVPHPCGWIQRTDPDHDDVSSAKSAFFNSLLGLAILTESWPARGEEDMADLDLQRVAFPTLDDVQVSTLAKFGTRQALCDGEHLFKAGDREYKFFVVERGAVEIVEHSSGETKRVALHERHAFGGDVSLVTGRPALIT
jgi:hypothetical protein